VIANCLDEREASDLSIDQVQWVRNGSKASKGVLLVDGDNVAWEEEVALNTLEVGLEEEGGGKEGVVDIESGVVEETSDRLAPG